MGVTAGGAGKTNRKVRWRLTGSEQPADDGVAVDAYPQEEIDDTFAFKRTTEPLPLARSQSPPPLPSAEPEKEPDLPPVEYDDQENNAFEGDFSFAPLQEQDDDDMSDIDNATTLPQIYAHPILAQEQLVTEIVTLTTTDTSTIDMTPLLDIRQEDDAVSEADSEELIAAELSPARLARLASPLQPSTPQQLSNASQVNLSESNTAAEALAPSAPEELFSFSSPLSVQRPQQPAKSSEANITVEKIQANALDPVEPEELFTFSSPLIAPRTRLQTPPPLPRILPSALFSPSKQPPNMPSNTERRHDMEDKIDGLGSSPSPPRHRSQTTSAHSTPVVPTNKRMSLSEIAAMKTSSVQASSSPVRRNDGLGLSASSPVMEQQAEAESSMFTSTSDAFDSGLAAESIAEAQAAIDEAIAQEQNRSPTPDLRSSPTAADTAAAEAAEAAASPARGRLRSFIFSHGGSPLSRQSTASEIGLLPEASAAPVDPPPVAKALTNSPSIMSSFTNMFRRSLTPAATVMLDVVKEVEAEVAELRRSQTPHLIATPVLEQASADQPEAAVEADQAAEQQASAVESPHAEVVQTMSSAVAAEDPSASNPEEFVAAPSTPVQHVEVAADPSTILPAYVPTTEPLSSTEPTRRSPERSSFKHQSLFSPFRPDNTGMRTSTPSALPKPRRSLFGSPHVPQRRVSLKGSPLASTSGHLEQATPISSKDDLPALSTAMSPPVPQETVNDLSLRPVEPVTDTQDPLTRYTNMSPPAIERAAPYPAHDILQDANLATPPSGFSFSHIANDSAGSVNSIRGFMSRASSVADTPNAGNLSAASQRILREIASSPSAGIMSSPISHAYMAQNVLYSPTEEQRPQDVDEGARQSPSPSPPPWQAGPLFASTETTRPDIADIEDVVPTIASSTSAHDRASEEDGERRSVWHKIQMRPATPKASASSRPDSSPIPEETEAAADEPPAELPTVGRSFQGECHMRSTTLAND